LGKFVFSAIADTNHGKTRDCSSCSNQASGGIIR
jgi:hypothetical protein